jgi:hypothetical protein
MYLLDKSINCIKGVQSPDLSLYRLLSYAVTGEWVCSEINFDHVYNYYIPDTIATCF